MSDFATIMTSALPVSPDKEPMAQRLPKAHKDGADILSESLRVKSVSEQVRGGRRVVNKRRNVYSEPLAELANMYFRVAGIPIRFWAKTADWRRWELKSFNMLNGDQF